MSHAAFFVHAHTRAINANFGQRMMTIIAIVITNYIAWLKSLNMSTHCMGFAVQPEIFKYLLLPRSAKQEKKRTSPPRMGIIFRGIETNEVNNFRWTQTKVTIWILVSGYLTFLSIFFDERVWTFLANIYILTRKKIIEQITTVFFCRLLNMWKL